MTNDSNAPSRRHVLRGGFAILAAGAAVRAATAQEKLAQDIVQYQATPKDGQKCSDCVNFAAPSACNIVAGTIAPSGWCVAFAPKA